MTDETHETEVWQVRERRQPSACAWCGAALDDAGRGRPRRYCSRSCRQREYELRTARQRYETDQKARPGPPAITTRPWPRP